MHCLPRRAPVLLTWWLLCVLAVPCQPALAAHAGRMPAPHLARTLTVSVQPPRIAIGRDTALRIRVLDGARKPVDGAVVSISGAGRPYFGTTVHGALTLSVHPIALAIALITVSHAGYAATSVKLPVVAGAPATVVAVKRGMSIVAPRARAAAGAVGADLLENYHALTGTRQFASLGLRDGTLVDLNSNTDVLIKDPLHATLNKGELFLQVVHGDARAHVVQVGTAIAATKGTRLDVRYNVSRKIALVTVVEGKVSVTNHGKSVLVGAGQQTNVPANQAPSTPKRVNVGAVLGWLASLPNSTRGVVPPVLNIPIPPVVPVVLPPTGQTPSITITSALESTNWSGVVLVRGHVTIAAGQTVTVQPGAIVLMDNGAQLQVEGTLSARGTPQTPITFTSAASSPVLGSWGGMIFKGAGASGSVLDNTGVFYGGYVNNGFADVLVTGGAAPTISNCIIGYAYGVGIYSDLAGQAHVTDCVFTHNASYAISTEPNASGLITGSRAGPAQPLGIEIRSTTSLTVSATWHRQDLPFYVAPGVKVDPAGHLTIEPGAVLLMQKNAWLKVLGTLTAIGTAALPILISSAAAQPAPGDWEYIDLAGASASGSELSYVQLFYGGYVNDESAMLSAHAGASPTIQNCVVSQSYGAGIYLSDDSRARVRNCTFAGNSGFAVSAPADASTLLDGNQVAYAQKGMRVRGTHMIHSGAWSRQNAPLVLDTGVTVDAGVVLTVEPGTTILMSTYASLIVSGRMIAAGTAVLPIVVASALDNPVPGSWNFVDFSGPGTHGSLLDHVQFDHGGYINDQNAALSVHKGADPTFRNLVVVNGYGTGLYVDDTSHPTITNCLFAADAGPAISLPPDDVAQVTGTGLGVGQKSIQVRTGTLTISGTWLAQDAPLVFDSLTVSASTTLTIAPGTQLLFNPYGAFTVSGRLLARGTASAPIMFSSVLPNPVRGDWNAFTFDGAAASGSVLSYVRMEYGGYSNYGQAIVYVTNGANPTISNSVFQHGYHAGIFVDTGCHPTISGNFFQDNQAAAISLPARDPVHVHGNTFGAGQQGVALRG